ncbi:MAG: glycerate kinase [Thermodesulfovibrionales bacterium]
MSGTGDDRRLLAELFRAAVDAVDPRKGVLAEAGRIREIYVSGGFRRLVAIAFGKAAFTMARAAEEALGDILSAGVAITKYGHVPKGEGLKKTALFEAGHPVPDQAGMAAAAEALRVAREADQGTLALCLVSGGGSALFVMPAQGVSLAEKQAMTGLLLKAGADINEVNSVRKHLSRVKGGRLAEALWPARTVSLIVSDVLGDRLDVIASGPTAPDPTTYGDALEVLERHGLLGRAPAGAVEVLRRGAAGDLPETPKPGARAFEGVVNTIIGGNRKALEAARERALALGLEAEVVSDALRGEARLAAAWLAEKARAVEGARGRKLLISGGETTVTVKGGGKGGRNTELALAFAIEAAGVPGVTLLSAGTDGNDGETDAAGAFADGLTAARAGRAGLDPAAFLADNDSYSFFREVGDLFITGPTGTNVMDLQLVLIR